MQTILFDVTGTIYNIDDSEENVRCFFTALEAPRIEFNEFNERFRKLLDNQIGIYDFWEGVGATENEKEDIEKRYLDSYILIPKFHELIENLKKEASIFILTNNPKNIMDYLIEKDDLPELKIIYSDELKMKKNNSSLYKKIIEIYDIDISRVVFVDDQEKNRIAAEDAGIKTFRSVLEFRQYYDIYLKM